jgi:hypothetical protein
MVLRGGPREKRVGGVLLWRFGDVIAGQVGNRLASCLAFANRRIAVCSAGNPIVPVGAK